MKVVAEFIHTDEHGFVMPMKKFNQFMNKVAEKIFKTHGIPKEDLFSDNPEGGIKTALRQRRETVISS